MLRKRGPITGEDLAAEWFNYRLMTEDAEEYAPTLSWPGPQRAYARIIASLPNLVRLAGQHRPCIAGWDAPIGLIHAGDPQGAATDGYPMAVAVATALSPGALYCPVQDSATMDQVIENVLRYADCMGKHAREFAGRLNRLLKIAARCEDVFALYEPFYREFLVTFPPWEAVFGLEMIPAALAICSIAQSDGEQAIIGAANLGRDPVLSSRTVQRHHHRHGR